MSESSDQERKTPQVDAMREQEDLRAPHLPKREGFRSQAEFLNDLMSPAGRYKSPLGVRERFMLEFQKRLAELRRESVSDSFVFEDPLYPIAPQWQAILNYLYGEGVITSPRVFFEQFFHDEPKIFSLRIFSVFDNEPTDGRTAIISGHSRGVSYDFEEALSKVIGEFLERYPLTIYERKKFIRASVSTLARSGKRFLDISDLAGFADWQREIHAPKQLSSTSSLFWTPAKELLSGKSSLIPAQLIFWNYNTLQDPPEPYLRQPITNGAAGHFTDAEATLAGIYEIIQRDAFLIHWLNFIAPPRIDLATITDPELLRLIEDLTQRGFEITLLNTTLDLEIPSCVCVLTDTSGRGPRIALGGGCGPDLGESLMRGMTEATGVYHWLRLQKEPLSLSDDYRPFRDPTIGQSERLLLWGNEHMFSRLKPFLSGRLQSFSEASSTSFPQSFENSKSELERVLEIFKKRGKGYEVYVYKAAHAILDTLGYSSVKVIIPALVPLYLNERDAPLAAPRLHTVPLEMGLIPAKELNPWPHPFP